MFPRILSFVFLFGVPLGCSKKSGDDLGGGGNAAGSGGGDDATAYTIKVRPPQKGDKVHVTKSRDGSTTQSFGGKSRTDKQGYRYEYTETVIEIPADSKLPTRADREYKFAEKTDEKGELKPLSFSGKTVEVQVSPFEGIGYIFIVGGNAIQPPDRDDLLAEFQGGEKPGERKPKPDIDVLLPKKAVKVGEEWTTDISAMTAILGEMPFTLDKDKSKITGKLVKAYKKDGAQWGTIELKIVMVVTPAAKGPPLSGTITADQTIDMLIDGSARARSTKMTGKGMLTAGAGKGAELKIDMNITQEEAATPVK